MALQAILAEALKLPDDERAELAGQLLRSLEPDDGLEVTGEEWEAAWSTELERRVRDLDEGRATLIDSEEAMRRVRAQIQSRRR